MNLSLVYIFLCVYVFSLSPFIYAGSSIEADENFKLAEESYKLNDFAKALKYYENVIKTYPKDIKITYVIKNYAKCLYSQRFKTRADKLLDSLNKSIAVLNKAKESDEKAEVRFLLADSFIFLSKYKEAQEQYEILMQNPVYKDMALYSVGILNLIVNDANEAERIFRQLSKDAKINSDILNSSKYQLAFIHFRQNKYDLVIDELSKLKEVNFNMKEDYMDIADRGNIYITLGLSYLRLGKYKEAIKTFQELIDKVPKSRFISEAEEYIEKYKKLAER